MDVLELSFSNFLYISEEYNFLMASITLIPSSFDNRYKYIDFFSYE